MKKYTLADIQRLLGDDAVFCGPLDFFFTNIKSITEALPDSLVWVNPTRKDKSELVAQTASKCIICAHDEDFEKHIKDKSFIKVRNPKLVFLRVVDNLFVPKPAYGVHPTAFVEPAAKLHPDTYVGPNCYIGNAEIGADTIIKGNCFIADNTIIGKNVTIHAGAVIGGDGFGYSRNEQNEFEKFPHIGGVIVEDNVEIGANTCIDRGTLGNTHIKTGAKIDNLVHIAHNVVVGKHAAVIALAMVGGSTVIGDYAWIAPSAALRDGIEIGSLSTVGMGAVVTKSIPQDSIWTGNPARSLNDFLALQKKLKEL